MLWGQIGSTVPIAAHANGGVAIHWERSSAQHGSTRPLYEEIRPANHQLLSQSWIQ